MINHRTNNCVNNLQVPHIKTSVHILNFSTFQFHKIYSGNMIRHMYTDIMINIADHGALLHVPYKYFSNYSLPSLSQFRLSRITAHLEEKI